MTISISGQTLGCACATRKTLIDSGDVIWISPQGGIRIARATYETPFGQVVGLRYKTLLHGRCFEWIGDQVRYIGNRACVIVKRLSDSTFWFCDLINGILFHPPQSAERNLRHEIMQTTRTSAAKASALIL